jgi:hypothetical protein
MFGFSRSSSITTTPYTYLNFLNKGNNPFRMQVPNYFGYLSIFVDLNENLVMTNDVVMPSNPPVAPIEQEELKEASIDVNVSQRSCEEEPSRKVVRTQVDHLAWDH